jgi:hypothetical protein
MLRRLDMAIPFLNSLINHEAVLSRLVKLSNENISEEVDIAMKKAIKKLYPNSKERKAFVDKNGKELEGIKNKLKDKYTSIMKQRIAALTGQEESV